MGFQNQSREFDGFPFPEWNLSSGCMVFWPMGDEVDGPFAGPSFAQTNAHPSVGRIKLGNFNVAPRVAGPSTAVPDAFDFTATNSEYLQDQSKFPELHPASGGPGVGGDAGERISQKIPGEITYAGWVYLKSGPTNVSQDVIGMWDANAPNQAFLLNYNHPPGLPAGYHLTYRTPDGNIVVAASASGTLPLNQWHHLSLSFDNQNLYIRINNHAETFSHGGSGVQNSNANLEFARLGFISRYSDLRLAGWGVWGRHLTDEEHTQLYNNGSGLLYENFGPKHSLANGVKHSYSFPEGGGSALDNVRADQAVDLDSNGTITSTIGIIGSGSQYDGAVGTRHERDTNPTSWQIGSRDWTLGVRFRPNEPTSNGMIIAKNNEGGVGGGGSEWNLQYIDRVGNTPPQLSWRVLKNGGDPDGSVVASGGAGELGPLDDGDYHNVMIGHINGSGIWIQIDDGPFLTEVPARVTAGSNAGNADLTVGSRDFGASRLEWAGEIDDITLWHRTLAANEIETYLTGSSPLSAWPFASGTVPTSEFVPIPAEGSNLENISDGNPYISVSGTPLFSDEIRWPFGSGTNVRGNVGFSEDLDACLVDLNAQFGFNQQPHRFTMSWVVKCANFSTIVDNLPPIGDEVWFNIGPSEFLIRGRLVHVDVTKSSRGFLVTTTVEDFRPDLSRISIDTYGLYDVNETPDANVVDVHHWFLTTQDGQDNPRQLRMLRENGATYRQIYDAINAQNSFLGSRIPDPGILQQNLPEDINSYRFTFRTTPALDALVKIFTDVSFDLYWNMGEDRLNVINRKEQIDLELNQIPFSENDPNNITASLKFGQDDGERPTAVQVLGDRMEGVLSNGGPLKSTGGTYDPSVQLDLSENATWIPGWRNASIFYFGEDGTLKEDNPSDEELSAALKGIEYWTLIKNQDAEEHLGSRLAIQSIDFRDGLQYNIIRASAPSGVGLIPNRGQDGQNWVIEWYNRVRNFAQNHYSRTYVLDQSSTLFSQLDRFDILNEAWTGLENRVEGIANYNPGYKIDPKFRWLAPFWDEDQNKLRAWAVIERTDAVGGSQAPLWGLDGKGVPTQFEQWNEELERVYVPIEVQKWVRSSSKFDSDFVLEAEKAPRGMLIRFPNIMWRTFQRSPFLFKFPSLSYLDSQFIEDSTDDLPVGPADEGVPYSVFGSGINIPVRTFERYGSTKPSAWTAGQGLSTTVRRIRTEVIQRDDLAPWNFEPISIQSSVDQLDSQGIAAANARAVNRAEVTFAEATKVGLPVISFDEYADENGCVKHGITNLSVLKNASQYWQTRYSAKTHFPQPVKIRPVREETMEDFRFALHRVNERLNRPLPPGPFQPPPLFDPKTEDGKEFISFPKRESFQVPVVITNIISFINDNGDNDIAYAGEDARGLKWPAARRLQEIGGLNPNSKIGRNPNAVAVDGFLQRGMQATYFYEDLGDGEFNHYFRGGIALTAARIVTSLGAPEQVEGVFRMDVEIPSTVLTVPVFDSNRTQDVTTEKITLRRVPFSDQQNVDLTLNVGDKVLIGGPGIENGILKPSINLEGEYEIDVSSGANKDQTFILTGGRAGAGTVFASVIQRPDDTTGRGAKIQTLSSVAGTEFEDGVIVGASEGVPGTRYFIDFVGIEFSQVSLGDTAIVTQEAEDQPDPTQPAIIRLLTYIPKPLFMSTDALGGSVG